MNDYLYKPPHELQKSHLALHTVHTRVNDELSSQAGRKYANGELILYNEPLVMGILQHMYDPTQELQDEITAIPGGGGVNIRRGFAHEFDELMPMKANNIHRYWRDQAEVDTYKHMLQDLQESKYDPNVRRKVLDNISHHYYHHIYLRMQNHDLQIGPTDKQLSTEFSGSLAETRSHDVRKHKGPTIPFKEHQKQLKDWDPRYFDHWHRIQYQKIVSGGPNRNLTEAEEAKLLRQWKNEYSLIDYRYQEKAANILGTYNEDRPNNQSELHYYNSNLVSYQGQLQRQFTKPDYVPIDLHPGINNKPRQKDWGDKLERGLIRNMERHVKYFNNGSQIAYYKDDVSVDMEDLDPMQRYNIAYNEFPYL